jgi:hypothetical protein
MDELRVALLAMPHFLRHLRHLRIHAETSPRNPAEPLSFFLNTGHHRQAERQEPQRTGGAAIAQVVLVFFEKFSTMCPKFDSVRGMGYFPLPSGSWYPRLVISVTDIGHVNL